MNPLTLQKRTLSVAPLRPPVRTVSATTPVLKHPDHILFPTSNRDRYGHVITTEPS
jgi:hypothetical protein